MFRLIGFGAAAVDAGDVAAVDGGVVGRAGCVVAFVVDVVTIGVGVGALGVEGSDGNVGVSC